MLGLNAVLDNRATALEWKGQTRASNEAYKRANGIAQELIDNYPLSADARSRHLIATSRVANAQMASGATSKALEQYLHMKRAIRELVIWDDTNAIWRRDYAATLLLMAEAHADLKQFKEAEATFDEALLVLRALAATDSSNYSLKRDFSWFHRARGNMALERKEWKLSIDSYTTAERYIAEVSQVDGTSVQWRSEWAAALLNLGKALDRSGRSAEAVNRFQQGRHIISALSDSLPEMTTLQDQLLLLYESEVRALQQSDRVVEAAALAKDKDRIIQKRLAAEVANANLLAHVFVEHLRVGHAAKAAGRIDDALLAYRKGLARIQDALKLEPDTVQLWDNLREAHKWIGDVLVEGQQRAMAETAYRDGLRAATKAFELSPHRGDLANRVFLLHINIGDVLGRLGKRRESLAGYEGGRQWIDKAIRIDPQAQHYSNRSVLQQRIGRARGAIDDLVGADAAFRAGVKDAEQAARLAGTQDARQQGAQKDSVHSAYESYAAFLESRGDMPAALNAHRNALAAIKAAATLDPYEPRYPDGVRVVYKELARLKEDAADLAAAEADLRAAADAAVRAAGPDRKGALISKQPAFVNVTGLALLELGQFYQRQESWSKALVTYENAARQMERAVRLEGNLAPYHRTLSSARRGIGEARDEADDIGGAMEAFGASIAAAIRATELAPTDGRSWQTLYLARLSLAMTTERAGKTAEGMRLLRESLSNAERAAKLMPDDTGVSDHVNLLREAVALRSR